MANCEKLFKKASNNLSGISFSDLFKLAECYGYELARIKGSHHIYKRPTAKLLTLQPDKDGKAKPYQVKQVLEAIEEITNSD
jgi:predicted RNA binding protein YcfA (HicA-like mRNA interferase family)